MAYGYGAEIARGAGQGMQTGAALGGTIGTAAGGQTAIGAGIGAGVGAIAGGIRGAVQAKKNPQRKELEELLKRQEMDALGLTDEERRILESQVVDPLAAQFRQQQALSPTQLSSGVAARMMMAQREQQDAARAAAAQQIAMADTAERVREEEEIRRLERGLYEQRKEDIRAAGQAAMDSAQTYMSAEAMQAQSDFLEEYQNRIFGIGEAAQEAGVADPVGTAVMRNAMRRAGRLDDLGPQATPEQQLYYMSLMGRSPFTPFTGAEDVRQAPNILDILAMQSLSSSSVPGL